MRCLPRYFATNVAPIFIVLGTRCAEGRARKEDAHNLAWELCPHNATPHCTMQGLFAHNWKEIGCLTTHAELLTTENMLQCVSISMRATRRGVSIGQLPLKRAGISVSDFESFRTCSFRNHR
jgi:hypothetical protein